MIQYGYSSQIIGGDPDQIQADKEEAARKAAEESKGNTGLLIVFAAAALYLWTVYKKRKRVK